MVEIDRYGSFEADTNVLAIHGLTPITDISKVFKSCFVLRYQKICILCLAFFSKTSKIRIYELKLLKLQQFQHLVSLTC